MKPGFKRTVNWNKYHSKVATQAQNQYLDYLNDLSFHGLIDFWIYRLKIIQLEQGLIGYFSTTVKKKMNIYD